ncbi:uncharacterized protein LOC106873001 isoform X2 [Octopus bimaculoides]|nr:uncharacterized protein LOC106873001 isoform X2 [Octopus bimaculoides]|eukprot:XP_014775688.1 PREDICTED: uncharacterized protein LOC106873001 [Octopus bimaculoides]
MCRQGVFFIVAMCFVVFVQSFDVKTFCKTRCAVGRGGNLCRCNAFHFAGKRSDGQYKRQEFGTINTDDNYNPFQSYFENLSGSLPIQRQSAQQNDYDDNDATTGNQMLYPVRDEALFRRAISEQMNSNNDQLLPGDIRIPNSNTRSQKEGSRLQNLLQKQYKRYKNNSSDSNNNNNLSGVLPIDVNDFNDRSARLRNSLHHTDKAGRR